VNRRTGVFVTLAVVLAALFVRLGFWQVDRLQQRRARNAVIASRLAEPSVPVERIRDSTAFLRATVAGIPDYTNEIVLTGKSRQGSPGVYIVTPVRRTANDTAVLVTRGWVYAPDAATVDLTRWHEARGVFSGYVLPLPATASPQQRANGRKLRTLTREGVRKLIPYPVVTRYLVSQDSAADTTPARLAPPALDDGPHLSYAIQWFSFAVIAIVGAGIVAYRARTAGSTAAERD
jgi:surfeit locus 1 family protein